MICLNDNISFTYVAWFLAETAICSAMTFSTTEVMRARSHLLVALCDTGHVSHDRFAVENFVVAGTESAGPSTQVAAA